MSLDYKNLRCPQCDGTAIQKLSAIASGPILANPLRGRLPAPKPPDSGEGDKIRAEGQLLTGCCLGLFTCGIAYIVGLILYLANELTAWRKQSAANKLRAVHQRDVSAWHSLFNRLYYCPRCDVLFDPASGQAVSPEHMNELL
ncbi:MAG: hypothetical protein HYR64_10025 [Fimbriimonas ginsengisoli]|uniref:Uncharacterized protein n=1 Tax=Fimbriimonas ginsengisoli TaxID=1005039 RepID=A0A931LTY6_FIMGI|nr:hypothetical protein [Fimbriimonas ginsengisoli]